ncbi:LysR family transcriptional regulator [Pelagerythrobacter rhizovicinus]|uniref:LysR family transcriptional regulator n=1 Tax=Pelagerythrobacter rhizovicinus TaxID=2268576 RepID=A0A4Q2KJ54_9SPHN|nr:LysR family transcriptional regulator [Pelagerythrobacter rhizovicinus]RXZ64337.1 LysR family transcriptional regulator [Pelagerythrobacter rhizovicinus]
MQDLNWNDIRVFLTVAEAGQIGRAARALRLDPTTLGRRLRRLERQLEITLFERTREGQTLTEAGESLLAKAEAMAQAARTIDAVQSRQTGLGGNLRLSVSEGFGSQFLTLYLADFARAHPNLSIELVANSGFLSPSKREADIAVMLSRPKAGPVICRKLSDYSLMLYASRRYVAAHGAPQRPRDLAQGHTLVSYIPDLLYAPELNYLDDFHAGLTAQIRSSSINAQNRLIEEGVGIGVLPRFIGDRGTDLVPVCPDRSIRRSFWIVTHRDTQNLARVRLAKEWLLDCVRAGRKVLMPD